MTRSTNSAEVVDARVALGEHVALEPLEPPDHLIHQPAHLGELARDRPGLRSDAVLDRRPELLGEADLELSRGGGQLFEPLPRTLQHGLDVGGIGAVLGRLCEALAGALDRVLIHATQTNVSAGCTRRSWITSCRRS